jgi:DNA polymerase I-like protein with 3'-5' exonuclease and polymerase domains
VYERDGQLETEYGHGTTGTPLLIIITDDKNYQSFESTAARYFVSMLNSVGISVSDCWWTQAHAELYLELEWVLHRCKNPTALLVGPNVVELLGLKGGITQLRGSIITFNIQDKLIKESIEGLYDFAAVPILDPYDIMRTGGTARGKKNSNGEDTNISIRALTEADCKKALDIRRKGYSRPLEMFTIDPTFDQVKMFFDDCLARPRVIALDIETEGIERDSPIVLIGLADTDQTGVCIPLKSSPSSRRWSVTEEQYIMKSLVKVARECGFICQNGSFDVAHIRRNFSPLPLFCIKDDTIILHHMLNPEAPQNLAYISSVYGVSRNWKIDFKDKAGNIWAMPEKEARLYNMRDAAGLFQLVDALKADLVEMGSDTVNLYETIALPLQEVTMSLNENGVPFSLTAQKSFRAKLEKSFNELNERIYTEFGLPRSFNLGSTHDLRILLFGQITKDIRTSVLELEIPDYAGAKLNKLGQHTKAHLDRLADKDLYELRPFWTNERFINLNPKTESDTKIYAKDGSFKVGKPFKTDDEGRVSLAQRANNRLSQIKSLTKKDGSEEAAQIELLLQFLHLYEEWAKLEKLLTTYTNFVPKDGRIYPNFNQTGTATGRYSCSKPNLQNWPKGAEEDSIESEVRRMVEAPPGRILVSADYSNLEVGTLAYTCEDPTLMSIFEQGINMHDVNTKALFGIDETDPHWKTLRKAAKIFQFANQYGSSVENSYRKICLAVPGFRMSAVEFANLVETSFKKVYNRYYEWREEVQRKAVQIRKAETLLGRVRQLHGDNNSIQRIALNTPSQGMAADIINGASVRILARLTRGQKLILQIHDQLVIECPESGKEQVARLLLTEMERPVQTIDGRSLKFPAVVGWGPNLYAIEDQPKEAFNV